ncbi:hypothetical protein JYT53_00985 [Cytophagaceae bacterium AH-315-L13]|nr:hypothetical protein [Cytophagaceae bacterium AH-315-L13]
MKKYLSILFLFFSICSYCDTVEETSLFYYDEAKLDKELDELTQLEFKVNSNKNQQDSIVDRALYLKGIEDANLYYQHPINLLSGFLLGVLPSFAFGFIAGIASGELGCVPITGCLISLIPPIFLDITKGKLENKIPLMFYPEEQLESNYSYMRGYKKQAHEKKIQSQMVGVALGVIAGIISSTVLTYYFLE